MRRLLALVSAVVLVDTMLYAALTPLLPEYVDEYDLSKGGAGLITAAYAAGALAGAVPAGIATARLGPRPAVGAGLLLLTLASLVFGFAADPWSLGLARLGQGLGSALTWTGALAWLVAATPRSRRGEMLGTALGAAVFGALLGPAVGAAAALTGERPTFVALAGLSSVMLLVAARVEPAAPQPQRVGALMPALAERRFVAGLWLMTLPSLLFGLLAVLAPLELSALGWGAVAIGAVFIVGASLEVGLNPLLGRFVDRRGHALPIRLALLGAIAVSLGLAGAEHAAVVGLLVVCAALAYGSLFTPAMALISDGAERQGLAQGLAFGVMNAAWAAGNVVGPAAGGALAGAAGDSAAYLGATAACLATLAAFRPAQATSAAQSP